MTHQPTLSTISRRVLALAAVALVAIAMLASTLPNASASTAAGQQSHMAGAPLDGGDDGGCFLLWDPSFGYYVACFGDD